MNLELVEPELSSVNSFKLIRVKFEKTELLSRFDKEELEEELVRRALLAERKSKTRIKIRVPKSMVHKTNYPVKDGGN